jgi:hypothetical protein
MTSADRILITLLLIALPVLYWQLWSSDRQASYLLIHSDNNPPRNESLTPQRTIQVTGALGKSTIEISEGRTRFISSPCTTKACIHAGWLSRVGEFAACLPNRVSLTLAGRHPYFDAINF